MILAGGRRATLNGSRSEKRLLKSPEKRSRAGSVPGRRGGPQRVQHGHLRPVVLLHSLPPCVCTAAACAVRLRDGSRYGFGRMQRSGVQRVLPVQLRRLHCRMRHSASNQPRGLAGLCVHGRRVPERSAVYSPSGSRRGGRWASDSARNSQHRICGSGGGGRRARKAPFQTQESCLSLRRCCLGARWASGAGLDRRSRSAHGPRRGGVTPRRPGRFPGCVHIRKTHH